MTPEEAIEFTRAAVADMPSGPSAEEILSVIQAQAWEDGVDAGRKWPADAKARNPYKSGGKNE